MPVTNGEDGAIDDRMGEAAGGMLGGSFRYSTALSILIERASDLRTSPTPKDLIPVPAPPSGLPSFATLRQ